MPPANSVHHCHSGSALCASANTLYTACGGELYSLDMTMGVSATWQCLSDKPTAPLDGSQLVLAGDLFAVEVSRPAVAAAANNPFGGAVQQHFGGGVQPSFSDVFTAFASKPVVHNGGAAPARIWKWDCSDELDSSPGWALAWESSRTGFGPCGCHWAVESTLRSGHKCLYALDGIGADRLSLWRYQFELQSWEQLWHGQAHQGGQAPPFAKQLQSNFQVTVYEGNY